MAKNRDAITPERWGYIKALSLPAPRFLWVSQHYHRVENTSPAGAVTYSFLPIYQYLGKPKGRTYVKKYTETTAEEKARE